MTSFNDQNVKRKLIMEHYSRPHNRGNYNLLTHKIDHYSTKCVDKIFLGLEIDNDIITDAKFQGEGCAVFLSSVDIMLDKIKNKSISDAKVLISEYENMIRGQKANEALLEELAIYANVSSHLNRLHCAEMISDALRKIIF